MKRADIALLIIVGLISALLFNLLQGMLSKNYILLIIFVFGFVSASIRRLFQKSD